MHQRSPTDMNSIPLDLQPDAAASTGLSFSQLGAMLRARRLTVLGVLIAAMGAALAISLVTPKTYVASADLFIDFRASDPINGKLFHPMMDEGYMQTQIDLIKSDEVAQSAMTISGILANPTYVKAIANKGEKKVRAEIAAALNKNLEVNLKKSSRVVELKLGAGQAEVSSALLNGILKSYLELANKISLAPARSRQEQYSAQLDALRDQMDKIQKAATEYQQEHNIVEPEERFDTASKQLAELSTRLSAAQAERDQAQAKRRTLQAMVRSGTPPEEIPEVANLKGVGELKTKLAEIETKLAEQSGVLGGNHPKVRALMSERSVLRERLTRESRTALDIVMSDEGRYNEMSSTLQGQIHAQQHQMLEMKKHRDVLGSFQRQLESTRKIYDSAAQKYDEILMASQINSPSIAVIRWAVPPEKHAKPLLSLNLAVSFPVGLFLGLCVAFLAEFSNRRLRSQEDLLRELKLPVLGRAV